MNTDVEDQLWIYWTSEGSEARLSSSFGSTISSVVWGKLLMSYALVTTLKNMGNRGDFNRGLA
jgi:hypothetical protein